MPGSVEDREGRRDRGPQPEVGAGVHVSRAEADMGLSPTSTDYAIHLLIAFAHSSQNIHSLTVQG